MGSATSDSEYGQSSRRGTASSTMTSNPRQSCSGIMWSQHFSADVACCVRITLAGSFAEQRPSCLSAALLNARCNGRRQGWVFPSERSRTGHLTTVGKLFRGTREKAGLPKDLVLYCGRHDYGTRGLQETGNLAAVMKTMGHKDVRTAMRYQHPELDIVREALNAPRTMMVQ